MPRSWREKITANVDEQTLKELNSAHCSSQAKCQLVQTNYMKRIKLFCVCHIINILLTELSRSVWENLDLGRVYRPNCVRSVLTTSVKILPYRPPARLIRANDHHLLPWVPEEFFFSLEATELSGEAPKASREVARKNITYSQNDQLPDGLIAQLVEHCIGITVVKI